MWCTAEMTCRREDAGECGGVGQAEAHIGESWREKRRVPIVTHLVLLEVAVAARVEPGKGRFVELLGLLGAEVSELIHHRQRLLRSPRQHHVARALHAARGCPRHNLAHFPRLLDEI